MGLFNLIKLANDCNKAKKLVEKYNVDKKKIGEYIIKVQEYVHALENFKQQIADCILRAKCTMIELSDKLQERKEG